MELTSVARACRARSGSFEAHALLHRAAQLEEALADLVGGQLVDGAEAAVAQVVDVVDVRLRLAAQIDDVADRRDEVLRPAAVISSSAIVRAELAVEAEAADAAEAVAVGVEELLVEELPWPCRSAAGCPGAGGRRSSAAPPRARWRRGRRVLLGEGVQDERVARVGDHARSCFRVGRAGSSSATARRSGCRRGTVPRRCRRRSTRSAAYVLGLAASATLISSIS